MRELDTNEVERVFSKCSEHIDKLIADYKESKGLRDFKPEIKFFPIGATGFMVLFFDKDKDTLGSIFNMEGNMIFTSYCTKNGEMN